MDLNGTQQMNFHSFVLLFGLMSKATLQERLKLIYVLHLTQLQNRGSSDMESSTTTESSKISPSHSVHSQDIFYYRLRRQGCWPPGREGGKGFKY